MRKLSFLALAAILTVCVLVQRPRLASAATTCPAQVCQTWINLCNEACPGPITLRPIGTCIDDGETENLEVVECRCVSRSCWTLQ